VGTMDPASGLAEARARFPLLSLEKIDGAKGRFSMGNAQPAGISIRHVHPPLGHE
jgi:hypothetical protein